MKYCDACHSQNTQWIYPECPPNHEGEKEFCSGEFVAQPVQGKHQDQGGVYEKEQDSAIPKHALGIPGMKLRAKIKEQMIDNNHGDGHGTQEIQIRIILLDKFGSPAGLFFDVLHLLRGQALDHPHRQTRPQSPKECFEPSLLAGKLVIGGATSPGTEYPNGRRTTPVDLRLACTITAH